MIDVVHITWLFTSQHEKSLKSFFKSNNIHFNIIDIIKLYLPTINTKNKKVLTTKAWSNGENEEYHCYFHAYISPSYNKREPPCDIWLSKMILASPEIRNAFKKKIW